MNKYTERNKALIFVPKCIVNNARTSSFEYKPDCNQRFYFVGAIEHDKHYNDDVNARLRRANPDFHLPGGGTIITVWADTDKSDYHVDISVFEQADYDRAIRQMMQDKDNHDKIDTKDYWCTYDLEDTTVDYGLTDEQIKDTVRHLTQFADAYFEAKQERSLIKFQNRVNLAHEIYLK